MSVSNSGFRRPFECHERAGADRRRRPRRAVDGDVPRPARRAGRSPSSVCAAARRCRAPRTSTCARSSCSGSPASRSEVKAQSEREFLPEGAIVMMDSLAGRKLADIIASLNAGVDEVSPCRRLFVSQPGLEPILRARAEQAGATVLDGPRGRRRATRTPTGVTVTARDVDIGRRRWQLRGRYLVGADGAHSAVRERLGIPFDGRGVFSNSITIYFTADLRPQMEGKPLSVIYINNPTFGGFFRLDKHCRVRLPRRQHRRRPDVSRRGRRRLRHQRGAAGRARPRRRRRARPRRCRSTGWPAGGPPPTSPGRYQDGPDLPRRRRRPPHAAERRLRRQHRHPRRPQPGLEARARARSGHADAGAARHLRRANAARSAGSPSSRRTPAT